MLVTQLKAEEEILKYVGGMKIFIFLCTGCEEVHFPRDEVEKFIESLKETVTGKAVLGYLCNTEFAKEYIRAYKKEMNRAEAILVFSCGVGVQVVSSLLEDKRVYTGCDTISLDGFQGVRVKDFACNQCEECRLNDTMGICPVASCPKGLLNGPCGGASADGKCEVDPEKDCAWYLIYKRLQKLGKLDKMSRFVEPRDWTKVMNFEKVEVSPSEERNEK